MLPLVPGGTLAAFAEVIDAMLAAATCGVDARTSGESVVTHVEALKEDSISSDSALPARCRSADARPRLIAISGSSSGDSAWRDRIDLSMLVILEPALES